MKINADDLDWEKGNGLIPAIVQDSTTGQVLMLGYMNRVTLEYTLASGKVTFWSRSRERQWTKGETSGNVLRLVQARSDCDGDTLLIVAQPLGPVCHTGGWTCFDEERQVRSLAFLTHLEGVIQERQAQQPENSYTTSLFRKGVSEISKKLGEEAVEVIISATQETQRTVEESADLVYHLLVLLAERGLSLKDVVAELESRHYD